VIVIVAGVSGSGKTTVGALVAKRLGWPFTDGDQLHPAANIAKMAGGVPLTDKDRIPWLNQIASLMDEWAQAGGSGVIACSALKRSYRDLLLDGRPAAKIVFLDVARDVVARRLAARHGHFFNPVLLDSQFSDLERPAPDERAVVTVKERDYPEQTADAIIGLLGMVAGSGADDAVSSDV